jgi:hypothetical protein
MSIFEKASRLKLTFGTLKGGNSLGVDDLWDLPLTSTTGRVNLDDLARALNKQLKSGDEVSFVDPERKSDERLQLAFDVVRHIINVKLAENAAAKAERDRHDKKKRLMEIIASKQDKALMDKPLEDLMKELETL